MATIVITWTPGGGANVTGQLVKRKLTSSSTYSTIATLSATASAYTDTTAQNNKLYDYQIITNCSDSGPSFNVGDYPRTIFIACGSVTITSSIAQGGGNTFPEIDFTIPNRLNTNTKNQSYQLKDSSNNAVTSLITTSTQNAVTGTIDLDSNNNFLSWNTTYTLEVTFRSTDNQFSRVCTFDVTTPAQPAACTAATGFDVDNEFLTDFDWPSNSVVSGGGTNPIS